jgi:hypothetical protein
MGNGNMNSTRPTMSKANMNTFNDTMTNTQNNSSGFKNLKNKLKEGTNNLLSDT